MLDYPVIWHADPVLADGSVGLMCAECDHLHPFPSESYWATNGNFADYPPCPECKGTDIRDSVTTSW